MQPGYTPYHYCFNDPVNGSDPSGLCDECGDDSVLEPVYHNHFGSPLDGWIDVQLAANDEAFTHLGIEAFMVTRHRTMSDGLPLGPVDRDVYVDPGPRMTPEKKYYKNVKGAVLDGENEMELKQLEMLYNHVCDTSVKEVFDLAEARGIRIRIKFDIRIDAYGMYISDDPNNECGLGRNPKILLNPRILTQVLYSTYKKPSNWIADIFDGDGFWEQIGMPAQVLAHELGHFEDGLLGRIMCPVELWNREFNSMTRENDFLKYHFMRPKNRYIEGENYFNFQW